LQFRKITSDCADRWQPAPYDLTEDDGQTGAQQRGEIERHRQQA
jgi:hypothetical protein